MLPPHRIRIYGRHRSVEGLCFRRSWRPLGGGLPYRNPRRE